MVSCTRAHPHTYMYTHTDTHKDQHTHTHTQTGSEEGTTSDELSSATVNTTGSSLLEQAFDLVSATHTHMHKRTDTATPADITHTHTHPHIPHTEDTHTNKYIENNTFLKQAYDMVSPTQTDTQTHARTDAQTHRHTDTYHTHAHADEISLANIQRLVRIIRHKLSALYKEAYARWLQYESIGDVSDSANTSAQYTDMLNSIHDMKARGHQIGI